MTPTEFKEKTDILNEKAAEFQLKILQMISDFEIENGYPISIHTGQDGLRVLVRIELNDSDQK